MNRSREKKQLSYCNDDSVLVWPKFAPQYIPSFGRLILQSFLLIWNLDLQKRLTDKLTLTSLGGDMNDSEKAGAD